MDFIKRHHKAIIQYSCCALVLTLAFTNCTGFRTAELEQIVSSASASPTPTPAATPTPNPTASPTATPTSTPTATPIVGNLLINGDFEQTFTGWSGNAQSTSDAHSGTKAIKIGSDTGYITQKVTVTAGKNYRFTAWGKRDVGATAQFYIGYNDGSEKTLGVGFYASTYNRLTFDFLVPQGVTEVGVYVYKGDSNYIFVDDISVVQVQPDANPPRLVAEGDSITTGGYAAKYVSGTNDIYFYRAAVGGSTMTDANLRLATVLAQNPTVVSLFMGANDFAGTNTPAVYSEKLFKYCDQVKATGAKCAVATLLPQIYIPNFNTNRVILNNMIRAEVGKRIDAVIDFAADPIVGVDSAANDTSIFPDGLHPNGYGQERLTLVYKPVIDKLLNKNP